MNPENAASRFASTSAHRAGLALALLLAPTVGCSHPAPDEDPVSKLHSAYQSDPGIKLYRAVASDSGLEEFHLTATSQPIRLLGVFLPADDIPGFTMDGTIAKYVTTFLTHYDGQPMTLWDGNPALPYCNPNCNPNEFLGYSGSSTQPRSLAAVQDAARLIKWAGFNTVRYAVGLQSIAPQKTTGSSTTPTYCLGAQQDTAIQQYVWSHMKSEIQAIEAPGLYTVIDLHGQVGQVPSKSNTTEYGCWMHDLDTFWQNVAQAFAGDPYIAAYELYNERKQGCSDPTSCQPTRDFYNQLAGDVLVHDQKTPLIVGDSNAGWQSGTSPGPALETWGPGGYWLGQANAGYPGMILSRHVAPDVSQSQYAPPWVYTCAPGTLDAGLDDFDHLAKATGRAMWIGEVEAAEGYDPANKGDPPLPPGCTPLEVNTFAVEAVEQLVWDTGNASAALFTINDLIGPPWAYLDLQNHPFMWRADKNGFYHQITYPSGHSYFTWPPDPPVAPPVQGCVNGSSPPASWVSYCSTCSEASYACSVGGGAYWTCCDTSSCQPIANFNGCGQTSSGLPNGSSCTGDAQCQSRWCGCNGGTQMVCLPNSSYPKTCAPVTAANGAPCTSNAQCQSNLCAYDYAPGERCWPAGTPIASGDPHVISCTSPYTACQTSQGVATCCYGGVEVSPPSCMAYPVQGCPGISGSQCSNGQCAGAGDFNACWQEEGPADAGNCHSQYAAWVYGGAPSSGPLHDAVIACLCHDCWNYPNTPAVCAAYH